MTQISIQMLMSPHFVRDQFVRTGFAQGTCPSQAEVECRFPDFSKELPFRAGYHSPSTNTCHLSFQEHFSLRNIKQRLTLAIQRTKPALQTQSRPLCTYLVHLLLGHAEFIVT